MRLNIEDILLGTVLAVCAAGIGLTIYAAIQGEEVPGCVRHRTLLMPNGSGGFITLVDCVEYE